ncbi:nucleolar and spindle-associated protein 1-like [Mytilus californianus]|uniref:nucleolar and spindle-associated protein 1-like n=1 Tax=Mytilus californianus TaxID=6549 RepID=UPI002246F3A8|nr:nucleolar and spindle-associated protein 1-like [Mytilus californianus]
MDVHNMKYNEMQKLAKQVGIKANMKFARLKTALIEYYQQENKENSPATPISKGEQIVEKTEEEIAITTSPKNEEKIELLEEKPAIKGKRKAKSKRTLKKKEQESKKDKKIVKDETSTSKSKSSVQPEIRTPATTKSGKIGTSSPFTSKVISAKTTPAKIQQKFGTNRLQTSINNRKFTPHAVRAKSFIGTPQSATAKSAQKRKISKTQQVEERPAKRTRTSFEKSAISNEPSPRLSSRRSTFSVEKTKKEINSGSGSPSIQDLVSSMDTEKNDEEMKKNLMQALDKKIQGKTETVGSKGKITNSTQIPRFAAFLEKKKQEQCKPITPGNKDWTKIHQKEFEKFDSIDVYLNKKRKHREETNMSVKKARMLVEQTKEAIKRLKNHKTPAKENKTKPKTSKTALLLKSPGFNSTKVFKPTVLSTKQMNLEFSKTRKSPRTSVTGFKPTVISTDKMNLNFNSMTTPRNGDTKTPKTDPRKSTGSMLQRKSFATPFKFNATLNCTVDGNRSVKRPSFDLKASLSRPMTWKSHKGKLKSVAETYSSNSAKSVKVQAREERRTSAMNKRTDQKYNAHMANRSVVH